MKKIFLITGLCWSAAASLLADGTNVLTDDQARVSYAIGMTIGHNFQAQSIDINDDAFLRGEAAGDDERAEQREQRGRGYFWMTHDVWHNFDLT